MASVCGEVWGPAEAPRAKRPCVAGREQGPLRADRASRTRSPEGGGPFALPCAWATDLRVPACTFVLPADPRSPNLLTLLSPNRMTPTPPRCGLAGGDDTTSARAL